MLGNEPLGLEMTTGIIAKASGGRTRIDQSLTRFYSFAVILLGKAASMAFTSEVSL